MRASCTIVAGAALLVACGPSGDPALGPCSERAPASAVVGTGQDKFEPIGQTIEVQVGPPGQGVAGFHIWYSLRCRNLGPHIVAEIGINDVATAELLTPLGLREAIDLEYNPDQRADEVFGIRAFLVSPAAGADPSALDPSMLLGRQVKLWVKADDSCKSHVEDEAVATVSGYLPP